MSENHTSHDWRFAGETGNDSGQYTKWACPCGAMKLKEVTVVEDESGKLRV